METKTTFMEKLRTIRWAYGVAWGIDKRPLVIWYSLSIVLAVLPAVALYFNRETLSILSGFISGAGYTYADVVPSVLMLGILLTLVGLSARVNGDLVYMMMYDKYYCGTLELLMDSINRIDMTALLNKELNDAYSYSFLRGGSLTNMMAASCDILSKLVSIASLLIVALSSSLFVFVISLVYVVLIFFLNFKFAEKTRVLGHENVRHSRFAEYYERISDNKGIAKETRIYENVEEIVNQWKKPYTRIRQNEEKRTRAAHVRDALSGAGFYVFLLVIVGVSLFSVAEGTMTPDVLLVLFTLCLNIYNAITGMARYIHNFDDALYALEQQRRMMTLSPLYDPKSDEKKESTPLDDSIVFGVENLSFSYADKPVLKDVSFQVKKGEVVALVGQNGSGKSTLVKLLLNMYKPQAGSISVLGRPYEAYRRDFIRRKIGVFFQDIYVFHQTLRENVAFGSVEDIDDAAKLGDAIKRGGAVKVVAKLSSGLETLLGKFMDRSGTELSGGEKQRVGAARAHMSNRDVLIFDEPASMLDPIAEMEQFKNIKDMLDGRTAILISHRIGFARLADKIIMLDGGVIAETGTHDELMAHDGAYARFFREQAQWYDTAAAPVGEAVV
jgi:ATP-binding cassette subfamily B protein